MVPIDHAGFSVRESIVPLDVMIDAADPAELNTALAELELFGKVSEAYSRTEVLFRPLDDESLEAATAALYRLQVPYRLM
jgi:hypothetical protein